MKKSNFSLKLLSLVSVSSLMALGAISRTVEAAPAMYMQAETGMTVAGTGLYTDLSNTFTFKINERYTSTIELDNNIAWGTESSFHPNMTHEMLRLSASDKKLGKVGDWDLGMTYRWNLPTTDAQQKNGTYGNIDFRPALSKKFGSLSILVRDVVSLHLQRNAYQRNVSRDTAVGNALVSNVVEFLPSYAITGTLTFNAALFNVNSLVGAAPVPGGATQPSTTWSNKIRHIWSLEYAFASPKDLTASISYDTISKYGGGAEFKLFSEASTAYLTVGRAF